MSKRTLIIVAAFAILVLGGSLTVFFFIRSKSQKGSSETGRALTKTTSKETEVRGDLSYTDTAGFSFKYPKGVKVADKTPADEIYYSLLELTKGSEKLTMTVKDSQPPSVDEFIRSDPNYAGASLVGAATLGGVSAKQFSLSSKLITMAIDADGVLYLLEGPKDGSFWEDAQSVVVSSFAFTSPSSSASSAGSTDETIYEEEEIVE